jgi:spore maturation protein CgeB
MITVVYSFNKDGYEAEYWTREIAAASSDGYRFVPFNHGSYVSPLLYLRAQLLDNLYYARHPGLARLYTELRALLDREGADALLVDNCPPYHPEFLRTLDVYKVLRIADGPISAYDRDFAYLHAYDHVFYHSPAYSRDLGMEEKLRYCGARAASLWPLALFDAAWSPELSEEALFARPRDVDVVFVGALHPTKMALLAQLKRALGRRFLMRGLAGAKKNLYFNVKYGFPGWVRPIAADEYVPLYQRARIGVNLHNRGKYTVGSYRLFELPANGVMQISDGGEYLPTFFAPDREIVGYDSGDELVERVRHYLAHENERLAIARAAYRRVVEEHRIGRRLAEAAVMIEGGIAARGTVHPARPWPAGTPDPTCAGS